MITFRDRMTRGRTQTGWLDSRHSFSFGHYHDPAQMGFGALRVINEDRVLPGSGFPTHSHADMEIISYVLEGALEHKDSLGNGSVIRPGDVQRMSAGTGISHSEYNPSREEGVHFLQIWIVPGRRGLPPGYEQKHFPLEERRGRFRLVGSPEGRDGAVTIHQDAAMYVASLADGESAVHRLAPGRGAWVQVARGLIGVNGYELKEGDGAALVEEAEVRIDAESEAEVLLFDLA
jgi:redox-sensitive bicupin YhaK (pirin superfamily)